NQIPYNLIERGVEVELLPYAMATDICITAYRPVLLGLLAGKYQPGHPMPEDSRGQVDGRILTWLEKYAAGFQEFNEYAQDHNWHPAQLAVAWQRKSKGLACPIVGVSSASQLQASIDAFDIELSDAQYEAVTGFFDTAVKEEAGGKFPSWRRSFGIIGN
ncbi:MAG: aldo/keto reductase, partial [Chloroflexota bacterium]